MDTPVKFTTVVRWDAQAIAWGAEAHNVKDERVPRPALPPPGITPGPRPRRGRSVCRPPAKSGRGRSSGIWRVPVVTTSYTRHARGGNTGSRTDR